MTIKNEIIMSLDKYWFKEDSDSPEKCRGQKMEEASEEFKFSKDNFTILNDVCNRPSLITTGLNNDLLESFVVFMCKFKKVFEFLKLAVSIAEDYIKDSKKGLTTYKTVREYVQEKLADFVPEDENEN